MSPELEIKENAQPLPNAALISALQRFGIAGSFVLLFVSLLVSAVKPSALGGIVGVNGVWIYSIAVAFFAVQHTWLRASGMFGTKGAISPATRWSRFAFLCMFLICINAFVTTSRGITHWGIVAGHDEPQYYAYLHSWVFDHDLNFENELKRIPGAWELMSEAHPERPEYNVAPIGTAIIWMPFYLAAHVVLVVLSALGESVPTDGISTPYAFACAFGSNVCVWLGMLMIHATLKRWFAERASFLATVLLWVASPIIWYQIDQPWMSHAPSFFAVALVLWVWVRTTEARSLTGWAALGAAVGLALLGRPTHAVLLLLPLADFLRSLKSADRPPRAVLGLAVSLLATLTMFSLQLTVWYFRYDWATEGINTPPGSPMAWSHPAIIEVLWSAHHGLFAWHPVLLAGFVGLIAFWKRARYFALCIALLLAGYVYTNAAIEAWYAGGSFGMRRFVCVLPMMAPGIAAFGIWAVQICRKHYMIPVSALIAVFFIYNLLFMVQLRTGWTAFLTPVSFQQVWSASATILHDAVGNPFSWPANLIFAAKHNVSPAQFDVVSGVPFKPDLDVQGPSMRPYLGTGWQTSYADAYRHNGAFLAQAQHNELFLYMHKGHAYDLTLSLSLPTQMATPQQAAFTMNRKNLGKATLEPNAKSELKLFVPGDITDEGTNILSMDFANVQQTVRTGMRGESGGHGLELPTREPYPAAAFIWRIVVATHYDTPQAK